MLNIIINAVFVTVFLSFFLSLLSLSLSLSHTHTHTHTLSLSLYIYIYIYIYIYEYFASISSLIHIWLNIIDIFIYIFFVNPFELPYWSYDIRFELVDKSSMIIYFPSTFCPTLGHHQERMYYKSDVTFVCTLLLCKKSVCTVVLCSVYFSNLFYK